MKKLLFLLAAVSLMLTSCLKENHVDKHYQRVVPGLQIAAWGRMQNIISMQPVDAAMRLALLLAEAEKQKDPSTGEWPDLKQIKVDGKNVFNQLFDNHTTIEKQENGDYRITFDPQVFDGYYKSKGALTVKTRDLQLSETSGGPDASWSVLLDPEFKVLVYSSPGYETFDLSGRGITLSNYATSVYQLTFDNMAAGSANSNLRSDWTGSFKLTAPEGGQGLAFSDCAGKLFGFDGSADGKSFVALDAVSTAGMTYEARNGRYATYVQMLDGTEASSLVGTYPGFPSSSVTVDWTLGEGGRLLTQTVHYNGDDWSQTYTN